MSGELNNNNYILLIIQTQNNSYQSTSYRLFYSDFHSVRYSLLGQFLRENIGGGEAYILRGGPKSETSRYLGLQALRNRPLKIGGVNTVLSYYKVLPKRDFVDNARAGEGELTQYSIHNNIDREIETSNNNASLSRNLE
jgi:hypothetical protein